MPKRKYSKVEEFLLEKGTAFTARALMKELELSRGHVYSALSQARKHDDVKLIEKEVNVSYSKKPVNSYRLEIVPESKMVKQPKKELSEERRNEVTDCLLYGNWNDLNLNEEVSNA